MIVAAGTRLGPYQVEAALGAGGMGEVFRARDTRLGREVAIKVLPEAVAHDPDRLSRFRREARLLAALNHPHIAAIYELEEVDGVCALILELVEGPTLAERMARGPIPLGDALPIARQIAGALDAAHERGIVHRDLKPANIKVRPDGTVKVLDFGLAKAVAGEQVASNEAPTVTADGTRVGAVLGTPAYMSPEQARGHAIDKRTDVWSFGCVLYEMLTGRVPFAGDTIADRIAGILERSPDWHALPADTPDRVRRLLLRTLEKDPARRLRDIGEAWVELDEATQTRVAAFAGAQPKRDRWRSWPVITIAGATLVVLIAGGIQLTTGVFGGASSARIGSVAVLPFANVNGGPDMDYQSDGITDGIIDRLARLPDLKVISRNAVFRYKGQNIDAQAVGRELGVEAVLTGRVLSRQESVIVTLELVDAKDNRRIWGEQYDRKLSDLAAVQVDIPIDISEKLRVRLSDDSRARLTKQSTVNADAYQLYLKGRYFYERWTREGAQKAVEYFREAIAKDPNYALAYAGLADTIGRTGVPQAEAIRTARDAATRALALDPTLGESHASLAGVLLYADWDFAGAEKAMKRAVELSPSSVQIHHMYAHYLMAVGRVNESLIESLKIGEIDPLTPLRRDHLGYHYLYARQFDKAIEQMREVFRMDEGPSSRLQFGDAYYAKGMYREAVEQYLKERALVGCTPEEIAPLQEAFAREGITGYLRTRIEQAVAGQGRLRVGSGFAGAMDAFDVARTYARLGEKDHVFEWLEKAYDEHSGRLVQLREEIDFDPVRTDPRFADLLRRVGLPPV